MTCACGHGEESHPRAGKPVAFVSGACMSLEDGEPCSCRKYRPAVLKELVRIAEDDTGDQPEELQRLIIGLLPVAEWLAQWPDGEVAFQCDKFHEEAAVQLDKAALALGVWPK